MYFFIMVFVIANIIIAVYFTYSSSTKVNQNMLLGVKLPVYAQDNNKVIDIVKAFKKSNRIVSFAFLILSFAILAVIKYPSLTTLFLFTWIGVYLFVSNKVYLKYMNKLMKLKRDNEWFVGIRQTVTVDMRVSALSDKMPVSRWWFSIPAVISLLPIILSFFTAPSVKTMALIVSSMHMLTIILFIYLYNLYCRQRMHVFSQDSEINYKCNCTHKRLWSRFWLLTSIMDNLAFLIYFILSFLQSGIHIGIMVMITASALTLVGIVITFNSVRNIQASIISKDAVPIITDDDVYWEKGYYYNPKDSRVIVEKRIGVGFTFNMATRKARMLTIGIIAITGTIIVSILTLNILMDFSTFTVGIGQSGVNIKAPMYNYSFDNNNIQNIYLVDSIPSGSKINGAGTARYNIGKYHIKEYGVCHLYINKNKPPYIVVKLSDTFVIFNGKTKEDTKEYYNKLIEWNY